ncbi:RCC1-like G exchanging factor-like protein [Holothuria leucospilota]|uniref:RCC1-like G exchanging factor-like protein n=1 Tax=Holothuria leucospilota TaxID=206669 RepID=A0A9Q1BDB2_HOLLE|nr:RCC1-like G exchanging factor-like protein [Holothuria leucospilota]
MALSLRRSSSLPALCASSLMQHIINKPQMNCFQLFASFSALGFVPSNQTLQKLLKLPSVHEGGIPANVRFCSAQSKRRAAEAEELPTFRYAGKTTKRHSNVHVCGFSYTGALGIPHFIVLKGTTHRKRKQFVANPYKLPMPKKITSVACGYGFTLLSSNSLDSPKVWGTGINTDSQLGFQARSHGMENGLSYVIAPARIELPLTRPRNTRVTQVACGRAHSIILTDTEGVFSLGNNAHGQCGRQVIEYEDYRSSKVIHRIKGIDDDIIQVACGHDHSLFLTCKGEVYSCGWGADGQTGQGHYNSNSVPTKVEGDLQGEKISQIASFSDCCLAVSENGDLFGWGNSEYNQLSVVTEETQVNIPRHLRFPDVGRIKSAAVGGSICAIVNEDGNIFTWGYGILGKGPNLVESKYPQCIPPTLMGQTTVNPEVKVSKVICGLHHFAALTDRGDLYTWGTNGTGCLGIGHLGNQYFPLRVYVPGEVLDVACGVDHTVILSKSVI